MSCTFRYEHCVELEIKGESRGPGMTREDDGLVDRFNRWLMEPSQKHLYPIRVMHSGGGAHVALWETNDAKLVVAWLRSQGVMEEP